MAEAVVEEYRSSLSELGFNSKPHINMLTMLAEDNVQHADQIVETIVAHINAVPPHMKLPGMYLVDSVIKNIGGHYIPLFGSHMTTLFTSVFEKVDENTRSQLYKLRLTWKDILPNNVLHHLDTQIREIDPAWPIIATEPPKQIHVNPKFIGAPGTEADQKENQMIEDQSPDEREKSDMKKTQLEVIKELEVKKEKLKKYELALREKLEKPKSVNVVAPTVVQPSVLNTRDPRLKKAYASSGQLVPSVKSFVAHPPNSGSLQSVVVVPNARTSNINDVKNEDGTSVFPQVVKSNDELLSKEMHENKNGGKTLSSSPNKKQKNNDLLPKSKNISNKKNSNKSKVIQNYDKTTSLKSHCENSKQYNKRRSISPPLDKERMMHKNSKKVSKQTSPKSKLSSKKDVISRVDIQESKLLKSKFDKREPLTQDRKRGKELLLKYKNIEQDEPTRKKRKDDPLKNQSRVQSTYIFGNDDKDYRSLEVKVPDEDFSKKSTFFYSERSSSHSPQYRPNFNSHKEIDRERSYKGKYSYYIDRVMHNPFTVMRQAEEKYNSGRISKNDYQDLCQNIKEMMENEDVYNYCAGSKLLQTDRYPSVPQTDFTYSIKEGCNAERNIVPAKSVISSEPAVKSFKLDNEMRNIYFVDKRAFTLMNNNEPRELFFDGPSRNIYIEGLAHPLRLGFNGHSTEFELGGRMHTVQFGVPGREFYVNSVPFEASFGGPAFVALLGDGKLHRIQIDGPPPSVLTSQKPAYELYEKFRSLHTDIRLPQIENRSSNEKIDALLDIDMRLRTSDISKPRLCFDQAPNIIKDMDWRQITDSEATKTVFDLSKPSYHTSYQSGKPELPTKETPLEKHEMQSSSEWDNKSLCPSEAKAAYPLKPPPLGPFLNPVLISNSVQRPPEPSYNVPLTTVVPSVSNINNAVFSNASVPNVSAINAALSNLDSIAKSLPQLSTLTSITAAPNIHASTAPTYKNEAIFPAVSTHLQPAVPHQMPNQQWQPLLPPPPFLGSIPSSEQPKLNAHQAVPLTVPSIQPLLLPTPALTVGSSILPSSDSVSTVSSASSPPKLNVELFLEKLIAAGIIGKKKNESLAAVTSDLNSSENSTDEVKDAEEEVIPVVELVPKSLREYHPVVINLLHKGSQCATCGMRFKEIQSEHYSRHLDWHFRTNRREKDGAKKPLSRRLYYEVKDWIDFKEFEDFEERAPSYFELQASGEQMKEDENENIQSVPSIRCETEVCSVCGEQFQLFWVEEEEEWHLKHAVRHNDQVYHPACYEDFCKASEKTASTDNELEDSIVKEEPEDKMDVESNSGSDVQVNTAVNSTEMDEMETVDSNPDLDDATSETVITVKTEPVVEPEQSTETIEQTIKTIKESTETIKQSTETVKQSKETVKQSTETVKQSTVTIEQTTETTEQSTETTEQSSIKEESSVPVIKSEPSDTSTSTPSETVTSNKDESTSEEKTSEVQSESSQTDTQVTKEESDDEMEFRPPTPDPNFENLPPVSRGTELSALCCIM